MVRQIEIRVRKSRRVNKITQDLNLKNLYYRDMHICQYCGRRHKLKNLTFDYLLPLTHGGRVDWNNIVTACSCCKLLKNNKPLEQTNMKLVALPYKPMVAEYQILRKRIVLEDLMLSLYRRSIIWQQCNINKFKFVGGRKRQSGCSSQLLV